MLIGSRHIDTYKRIDGSITLECLYHFYTISTFMRIKKNWFSWHFSFHIHRKLILQYNLNKPYYINRRNMSFTDLEVHLNGNDIRFTCDRIPLVIVNGIRRFSMNAIPIAGFRDEPPAVLPPNRSITIEQNHTLLYNEMCVTRIAMLPIRQDALPHIMSRWNEDSKQREFDWERPDDVPTCSLEITNDDKEPGILDVTTDMMDRKELFVKDLVLDTPILLHSLMFPYPGIDIPFSFTATPVIGTGSENSSFTPVGTTGMRFLEDEDRVESVMRTWMDRKSRERESKGLTTLSTAELDVMRKNFLLLEKQRIYRQDASGPTHIRLRVESLGGLPSIAIVTETLRMMAAHVGDLYHTLDESSIHQEQTIVILELGKVDHTVAQLIVEAWKLIPMSAEYSLPSYELNHPLKGDMRIQLRIVDESKPVVRKTLLEALHLTIGIVVDDLSYLIHAWNTASETQLAGASASRRSHSTFADPPSHWNWIESLPLMKQSLLPTRGDRSRWMIEPSLFRNGS